MACAAAGERKPMKGKFLSLEEKNKQIYFFFRYPSRCWCYGKHHTTNLQNHVTQSGGIISSRFSIQMSTSESPNIIKTENAIALFVLNVAYLCTSVSLRLFLQNKNIIVIYITLYISFRLLLYT